MSSQSLMSSQRLPVTRLHVASDIHHAVYGPKRKARAAARRDVLLYEWPPPDPPRPVKRLRCASRTCRTRQQVEECTCGLEGRP